MIVIWRIISFFLSPAGMAIAALAAFGAYTVYQRHDAVVDERAKVETRKINDVKKARKARDNVRSACERDRSKCLPDDWFRD